MISATAKVSLRRCFSALASDAAKPTLISMQDHTTTVQSHDPSMAFRSQNCHDAVDELTLSQEECTVDLPLCASRHGETIASEGFPVKLKYKVPVFGRGLFATKPIKSGELVLDEKPVLRIPSRPRNKLSLLEPAANPIATVLFEIFSWARRVDSSGHPDPLACKEFSNLDAERAFPLSKDQRAILLESVHPFLVAQFKLNDWLTEEYLEELFMKISANLRGSGLYRYISQVNHSCYPNAGFKLIQSSSRQQRRVSSSDSILLATTDIEEGDQIFVSYPDYEYPLELLEMMDIQCCNDPSDLVGTMDCKCFSGRSSSSILSSLEQTTEVIDDRIMRAVARKLQSG